MKKFVLILIVLLFSATANLPAFAISNYYGWQYGPSVWNTRPTGQSANTAGLGGLMAANPSMGAGLMDWDFLNRFMGSFGRPKPIVQPPQRIPNTFMQWQGFERGFVMVTLH